MVCSSINSNSNSNSNNNLYIDRNPIVEINRIIIMNIIQISKYICRKMHNKIILIIIEISRIITITNRKNRLCMYKKTRLAQNVNNSKNHIIFISIFIFLKF